MGLYVVRYRDKGTNQWGVVKEGQICPVPGLYESLQSFLRDGINEARQVAETTGGDGIPLESMEIVSPVTEPARIVCQGANYANHRTEAGMTPERPPFNLIFHKADSSLASAQSDIICPKHVKLLDYEIELGLVIGKSITERAQITDDNLHEYVAGLVIVNDISARDIQLPQSQWYKGKSYRTFCPVGPYLYILDKEEVTLLHDLDLKLWVNGELRQSTNTQQMLYKPAETLTELSEIMNLSPGDLVLTGTPGGVALRLSGEVMQLMLNPFENGDKKMKVLLDSQLESNLYLKDGDVIHCEIKSPDGNIHLGVQENRVVFE